MRSSRAFPAALAGVLTLVPGHGSVAAQEVARVTGPPPAPVPLAVDAALLSRALLAGNRPGHVRGTRRRRGRRARQPQHSVRRDRIVGVVQVNQRRHHLRSRLRGRRHPVDRRHRHPPGRPERGLRGHRGGGRAQQHLVRRRHLQNQRRWRDLETPGTDRHGAFLAHRHRSGGPRNRLRGSDGPRMGTERATGPVPQPGRGRHVAAGALHERDLGRQRRGHRPAGPRHRLRRDVRLPAPALALPQRRPRQWPLPLDRRRRHLGPPDGPRPAQRPSGCRRRRPRGHERARRGSEPRLRADRVAGGRRTLAFRRPRAYLAHGQRRKAP